jgi:hypothetical protein
VTGLVVVLLAACSGDPATSAPAGRVEAADTSTTRTPRGEAEVLGDSDGDTPADEDSVDEDPIDDEPNDTGVVEPTGGEITDDRSQPGWDPIPGSFTTLDTDGDGHPDSLERASGWDPLVPDGPAARGELPSGTWGAEAILPDVPWLWRDGGSIPAPVGLTVTERTDGTYTVVIVGPDPACPPTLHCVRSGTHLGGCTDLTAYEYYNDEIGDYWGRWWEVSLEFDAGFTTATGSVKHRWEGQTVSSMGMFFQNTPFEVRALRSEWTEAW